MQVNHICPNHFICEAGHFTHYKNLHQLPKESKWVMGQYLAVPFIVPVIIEVHEQIFEVFTLVSEIHDNVDLVLGVM